MISNDELLATLRSQNADRSAADVADLERKVALLLSRAGARQRFVRDREHGETAFRLTIESIEAAIAEAGIAKEDLDLIIYCGVGRGFIEPANASFVAQALGVSCPCFDVNDACVGWLRAVDIVQAYMGAGRLGTALVVNSEFTVFEHGFPDVFRIGSDQQLAYTFPALTIGEAATATVLTADASDWSFDFWSEPALADRCSIPLPGYAEFCHDPSRVGLNGPGRFVSFGVELNRAAERHMLSAIPAKLGDLQAFDLWIPHAATSKPYKQLAMTLGIDPNRVYSEVFATFGNIISASIPVGITMALEEGLLRRGDRVVLCPAGAGMSFGLASFTF